MSAVKLRSGRVVEVLALKVEGSKMADGDDKVLLWVVGDAWAAGWIGDNAPDALFGYGDTPTEAMRELFRRTSDARAMLVHNRSSLVDRFKAWEAEQRGMLDELARGI
jgi:hypothetical protein